MAVQDHNLMIGPLLLGTLISYYLMGAYTVQLYNYVKLFGKRDKSMAQVIVATTTILELLQMVFITHSVYVIIIAVVSDPSSPIYSKAPWSSSFIAALNGLVAFVVQMFRLWRIKRFMRSTWTKRLVAPLIFLLCCSQCGAAIYVSALFIKSGHNAEHLDRLRVVVIAWLALTIVCDLLLTLSIVIPLLELKASTVYRRTKEIIDVVVLRTVENGSITMLFSIPYIVLYVKYPTTFLGVAAEFILGRLYANVLLATLNCRNPNAQEAEFKNDMPVPRRHNRVASSLVLDSGSQTFDRRLEFVLKSAQTDPTASTDVNDSWHSTVETPSSRVDIGE